jgi:hypothetical protein
MAVQYRKILGKKVLNINDVGGRCIMSRARRECGKRKCECCVGAPCVPLLRTAGSVLWLICRVVAGAEDESEAGDEPKGDQPSILLAQSGWVPNPGKARPRGRRLRRQGLDRGLTPSSHCHQEFDGGVRLIAGLTCRVISRRHVLNGPSFRQPSTLGRGQRAMRR